MDFFALLENFVLRSWAMNVTLTVDPQVLSFTRKNKVEPEEFFRRVGMLFAKNSDFSWEEIEGLTEAFEDVENGRTKKIVSFAELR